MTADETLLAHTEQWGAELDQPTPDTLTAAEAVLTAHEWTVHDACLCGWQQTAGRSHPGHVVQQLAAAGLLAALAELRPQTAPAPRPAVRTGSFAARGGQQHLADEEAS